MFGRKRKKEKPECPYYHWMLENWTFMGGMITQATASRLLNVSRTRISQMVKEGKLKETRYKDEIFVSYPEIMKIAKQKEVERELAEIQAEKDKLKGKLPQEEIDELYADAVSAIKEAYEAPETEQ